MALVQTSAAERDNNWTMALRGIIDFLMTFKGTNTPAFLAFVKEVLIIAKSLVAKNCCHG